MSRDDQKQLNLDGGQKGKKRGPYKKVCSRCKEKLPKVAFAKSSKAKDGLQYSCRKCQNAYAKKRWEAKQAERWLAKQGQVKDPVNSPEHYKTGEIECIDAMVQVFGEDAVRVYARINAFKYQWRHRYKGKPEEDLAKAAWYTRFADGDDPRKESNQ